MLWESNNVVSPKMWQLAWNESQTSRQPGNPGTVATQAGEMVSSHIGLSHCDGKHGDGVIVTAFWIQYSSVIIIEYIFLGWRWIFFSKEKHFCPNQPHHPRCRTSSGVHWAFLDIGALSGGPWIFHVKFCPGLRENAEMSVIKISLLQNLPSFSQKFQLFSVMFCPF